MNKKLITEVAGIVEAPAGRVWAALAAELLPGDRRSAVEDAPTVEVAGHTISVQGGWWYRGEWSVEPHPQGALVVHRVFNVAEWMRWAVPLANRMFAGFAETTRQAFGELLANVGRRAQAPARPV
ncbi:hypothetical protein FXF51_45090 [Nonomuraea sp. PA05]|uniref:hypothetical protein n=1 Tax=Nonomuraea sp. PA05 TaxID=2604466 RepID=UPI0011DBA45B|nr:hypothetical protein [Nonomuraea sp. PA05]TYB55998.1 hypothetical protein FXF51_45090 [Nonomuraea sp. PA05]